MSSSKVLREALQLLRGGDSWVKGRFKTEGRNFCALGAIAEATWGPKSWTGINNATMLTMFQEELWELEALEHLADAARGSDERFADYRPDLIAQWNDHPAVNWAQVKQVFERAIELADAGEV